MKVAVQLTETSQPREHDAVNAYVKGPFYCVQEEVEGVQVPPRPPLARGGGLWNSCLEDGGVRAGLRGEKTWTTR